MTRTSAGRAGSRVRAAFQMLPLRDRSLALSTKLVLFGTLLTAAVMALGTVCVSLEIRRNTRQLLVESLARSQQMVLDQQRRDLMELLRTSSLIAENPTLRAAMETYRSEADEDEAPRQDLLATIGREVEKLAASLGKDLLVVTDEDGAVLAAAGASGRLLRAGEDLSSQPAIRDALRQTRPIGPEDLSVFTLGGDRYQVGSAPIVMQGITIGTLTLGDRIDAGFLRRLREHLGGEVVVAVGDQLLGTSLNLPPGTSSASLEVASLEKGSSDSPGYTLRVGAEEFVTASTPLGRDESGRPGRLYLLHSIGGRIEDANRSFRSVFVQWGSGVLLLAAILGWLLARSLTRPLESFVAFMGSVAESGDQSSRFLPARSNREVRALNDAYDRLIASLGRTKAQLSGAQAELVRLDRIKETEKLAALGQMLSSAAHEINNPLTGVVGNIELLLTRQDLSEGVRPRLETALREGRRIVDLVRNLLKISRRDKGRRTALEVNGVILDAVCLCQHEYTAAGMRLDLKLAGQDIWIRGNEVELQQVFLNIIRNAFDALRDVSSSPTLAIRSSGSGNEATVVFEDNGPGMRSPKEVFEPFYTTKEIGKGTGLGLTICFGIIQEHGGQITAENVPGGGARFTLALPAVCEGVCVAEAAGVRAPKPDGHASGAALRASVLIVDDEECVRDLQTVFLRTMGADVVAAASGQEAIEILKSREFAVVVSDMKMPGGVSGQDLFRWAESHRPAAAGRFLFVTGDSMGEGTQQFLKGIRNRCLLKPFSMEEYVAAVREVAGDPAAA